jgi:hypothetical protein
MQYNEDAQYRSCGMLVPSIPSLVKISDTVGFFNPPIIMSLKRQQKKGVDHPVKPFTRSPKLSIRSLVVLILPLQ